MKGGRERNQRVRGRQIMNPCEVKRLVPHSDVVAQTEKQRDPDGHLDHHRQARQELSGRIDPVLPIELHGLLLQAGLVVRVFLFELLHLRRELAHPLLHPHHVHLPLLGDRMQ